MAVKSGVPGDVDVVETLRIDPGATRRRGRIAPVIMQYSVAPTAQRSGGMKPGVPRSATARPVASFGGSVPPARSIQVATETPSRSSIARKSGAPHAEHNDPRSADWQRTGRAITAL